MKLSDRRRQGAFEHALAFCRARRVFRAGDRVLVGSGSGVASLGVLGFLKLAQHDLGLADVAVASVDRGGADDPDAIADTGRFARVLSAPFYAVSADGMTVTRALVALAKRERYRCVALGHTRDDAVARVLGQLCRGGGLDAVVPFVARRRDGLVRPFLDLREAEALELARTAGIEPPQLPPEPGARPGLDARLRVGVLPRLRVEVSSADDAILAFGREARELIASLDDLADAWLAVDAPASSLARLEIRRVGSPRLARAVARRALHRLGVGPTVARGAEPALARLLERRQRSREDSREVVLGSGLIGTYVEDRQRVVVRSVASPRSVGGGVG